MIHKWKLHTTIYNISGESGWEQAAPPGALRPRRCTGPRRQTERSRARPPRSAPSAGATAARALCWWPGSRVEVPVSTHDWDLIETLVEVPKVSLKRPHVEELIVPIGEHKQVKWVKIVSIQQRAASRERRFSLCLASDRALMVLWHLRPCTHGHSPVLIARGSCRCYINAGRCPSIYLYTNFATERVSHVRCSARTWS